MLIAVNENSRQKKPENLISSGFYMSAVIE